MTPDLCYTVRKDDGLYMAMVVKGRYVECKVRPEKRLDMAEQLLADIRRDLQRNANEPKARR